MQLKFEGRIVVLVPEKRKCHSSLDLDENKDVWVMSFGDDEGENQDIEVEFNISQLKQHRKMINKVWDKILDEQVDENDHFGKC